MALKLIVFSLITMTFSVHAQTPKTASEARVMQYEIMCDNLSKATGELYMVVVDANKGPACVIVPCSKAKSKYPNEAESIYPINVGNGQFVCINSNGSIIYNNSTGDKL